jgi:hypothetical protein
MLAIAETPNRLSPLDEHTSYLPFFSQLPRGLQIKYAARSPRDDFKGAISSATSPAAAMETMTRWGSGISFHEFEIAIGPEIHNSVVLDGYEEEVAAIMPVTSMDSMIQMMFDQTGVVANRAYWCGYAGCSGSLTMGFKTTSEGEAASRPPYARTSR